MGCRDGCIAFLRLPEGTVQHVHQRSDPVDRVGVYEDEARGVQMLLFFAGGNFSMVLDRRVDEGSGEFWSGGGSEPVVQELAQFSRMARMWPSVVRGTRVVAVHEPSPDRRLRLFGSGLDAHPLFNFHLPSGVSDVLPEGRIIFAAVGGRSGAAVLVLSALFSGADQTAGGCDPEPRALVQRLSLPPGERLVRLVPMPCTEAAELPTCTAITTTRIIDLVVDEQPNAIFLRELQANRDPETLGATLGLDLRALYQTAAEQLLQRGEFDRALGLVSSDSPPRPLSCSGHPPPLHSARSPGHPMNRWWPHLRPTEKWISSFGTSRSS